MRKILLLSICSAACSFGAAVCGSNDNVLADSYACTFGGLTFSNFSMSTFGTAASSYTPEVRISNMGTNNGFGEVYLEFDPLMSLSGVSSGANNTLDAHFFFTVTAASGGIAGIDLGNSGHNASIMESVCATPFSNGTQCLPGPLIGQLEASNQGLNFSPSHVSMKFVPVGTISNPIYVYKNIHLASNGLDGAQLTAFSQSFLPSSGSGGPGGGPGSVVPEPYTFLSVGGGLIAVALYMKRRSVSE